MPLMSEDERRTVLEDWNATDVPPLPHHQSISHWFEHHAALTPTAIAEQTGELPLGDKL